MSTTNRIVLVTEPSGRTALSLAQELHAGKVTLRQQVQRETDALRVILGALGEEAREAVLLDINAKLAAVDEEVRAAEKAVHAAEMEGALAGVPACIRNELTTLHRDRDEWMARALVAEGKAEAAEERVAELEAIVRALTERDDLGQAAPAAAPTSAGHGSAGGRGSVRADAGMMRASTGPYVQYESTCFTGLRDRMTFIEHQAHTCTMRLSEHVYARINVDEPAVNGSIYMWRNIDRSSRSFVMVEFLRDSNGWWRMRTSTEPSQIVWSDGTNEGQEFDLDPLTHDITTPMMNVDRATFTEAFRRWYRPAMWEQGRDQVRAGRLSAMMRAWGVQFAVDAPVTEVDDAWNASHVDADMGDYFDVQWEGDVLHWVRRDPGEAGGHHERGFHEQAVEDMERALRRDETLLCSFNVVDGTVNTHRHGVLGAGGRR